MYIVELPIIEVILHLKFVWNIRKPISKDCMKQKKSRDYKSIRQWTDENRLAKNRLGKNIKAAKTRGELGDDKLVPQQLNNENKGEKGE